MASPRPPVVENGAASGGHENRLQSVLHVWLRGNRLWATYQGVVCANRVGGPSQYSQLRVVLHRKKARRWNKNRLCPRQERNCGTHGCLDLNDLETRVLLAGGIHSLPVGNQGKLEGTLLQDFLKLFQIQPDVVGVEILVLAYILEILLVCSSYLSTFSERQPATALLALVIFLVILLLLLILYDPCQVATLAVCLATHTNLHEHGRFGALQVPKHSQVDRGTKVVTIRDEHVPQALLCISVETTQSQKTIGNPNTACQETCSHPSGDAPGFQR